MLWSRGGAFQMFSEKGKNKKCGRKEDFQGLEVGKDEVGEAAWLW